MAARVPVTFSPAGVTVWVASGSTVLSAAHSAGVLIPAPCGGRGVCGSCGVRVVEGSLEPADATESAGLAAAPHGVRLACRARVSSAVALRPIIDQQVTSHGVGPGDDQAALVAAVDLGTTTVSAIIVSRTSGRELGRATVPNAQQIHGSDVLSRISAAIAGSAEELAAAGVRSALQALEAACGRAGSCLKDVDRLVIAGNTAMIALLAGADVSSLAAAPFGVPAGVRSPPSTGSLQLALPKAKVTFVPAIASFVGGDALAGLLAAGMLAFGALEARGPEILVDVGTNAEILAVSALGLTVASAPAGPAFEGFGISSGGTWANGAIEQVTSQGNALLIAVAGGGRGGWLCGSGLISAIATLRRAGHIQADGLMIQDGPWRDRFSKVDGVVAFSLSAEGTGAPFLLQTDVRAFQTAKAAVAAGISAVVASAKIKSRAVLRVVIAGGFGSALDSADLVTLGVVPEDLAGRMEMPGNTALLGAAMIALDAALLEDLEREIPAARHIELATDAGFAEAFIQRLALEPFRLQRARPFGL